MNYPAVTLFFIAVLFFLSAGCTQFSGSSPVTPDAPATLPTPEPATPVPVAVTLSPPQQVVTIYHQVSLLKDIKDTELLFTLQVPVEWMATTHRILNTDNSADLVYQTDLVADNVFSIQTYAASRSQDQAYRDQFRTWSPAPAETTVTMNEITYDRFESTSGGRTQVAYVVRKSSANERGYASVIVFAADTSDRFEKEDFETVVASFRYFPGRFANTMPGDEIPRISLAGDSSGSAQSLKGGSDAGTSGGSSSGCSRCGV